MKERRRFFGRLTRLKRLMLLLTAVAVLLSLLFGSVFAWMNRQNIYQTVRMEMDYDTRRIKNYMDAQMENVQNIFDELLSDSFLEKYTSSVFETDTYDLIDFSKRLQSMANRNGFVDTIDVYVDRTGVLFTSDYGPTAHIDGRTQAYLRQCMEDSTGLQITKEYRGNLYYWLARFHNHVTFTFPIYSQRGTMKVVGLAAVSVRETALLNLLGGGDGRYRLLLDEDDRVFLTNQELGEYYPQLDDAFEAALPQGNGVERMKLYGEEQLVAFTSIGYTGWRLVVMTPLSALTSMGDGIGNYAVLLILLNVALILAAEALIIRYLSRRIQPLLDMMENVKQGEFQTEVTGDEKDEFSYLFDSFYSMQQRIQQQFNEIYHLSLLQKEANLKLMHAQINPHFIYNIFYNMNWLIQLGKYGLLEDMVEAAAIYFKKSLNGGRPFISIGDEAQMLESYIAIQRIRFGDRFQAALEIAPELMDIRILGHLLQPLVENAIRHGVEPLPGQGKVVVRGFMQDECLCFEVEDNGVGMESEKLNAIRKTLERAQTDTGEFFALNNVHQRIQILYGEQYGLQVESQVGKGTLVRVVLPKTPPKKGISAGMGLE